MQPEIIIKARSISLNFQKLKLSMFSGIHRYTSHSEFLTEDDILRVDKLIRDLCSFFREKFPFVRFTLKLHILEDHAVENLINYSFGMGLSGEQGIESIHHKIKKISHCFVGMRVLEESTTEEHYLSIRPGMRCLIPTPESRK